MRTIRVAAAALLLFGAIAFGVATAHTPTHFHGGGSHGIVADSSFTGHSSYLSGCAWGFGFGWTRTEWHNHYTRTLPGQPWVYSHNGVAGYFNCL